MASYAVIWAVEGCDDPPLAGRLQISDQGVVLHGGQRGAERRVEISPRDILRAHRTPGSVGPLRAIALDAAAVGTILIATFAGIGARLEILEQLQRLVTA